MAKFIAVERGQIPVDVTPVKRPELTGDRHVMRMVEVGEVFDFYGKPGRWMKPYSSDAEDSQAGNKGGGGGQAGNKGGGGQAGNKGGRRGRSSTSEAASSQTAQTASPVQPEHDGQTGPDLP